MNLSGRFVGKLRVEYIDGITWKVINPQGPYAFGFLLNDGRQVIIPDGFITDFASIPRPAQNILPAAGSGERGMYGFGAVCHDLVYQTGEIDGQEVTQHEADHLLKACNEAVGVDPVIIEIINSGLVVGGFAAWNHYRNGGTKLELMSCHESLQKVLHQKENT